MKPTPKNQNKVTYQIKRYYSKNLKRYMYRIVIFFGSMYFGDIEIERIEDILYKKQAQKLVALLQNKNWKLEILKADNECRESILKSTLVNYNWKQDNLRASISEVQQRYSTNY
jgi:hypothetical protein